MSAEIALNTKFDSNSLEKVKLVYWAPMSILFYSALTYTRDAADNFEFFLLLFLFYIELKETNFIKTEGEPIPFSGQYKIILSSI